MAIDVETLIINKRLHEIDEDDILVYLDAGCSIIKDCGKKFLNISIC